MPKTSSLPGLSRLLLRIHRGLRRLVLHYSFNRLKLRPSVLATSLVVCLVVCLAAGGLTLRPQVVRASQTFGLNFDDGTMNATNGLGTVSPTGLTLAGTSDLSGGKYFPRTGASYTFTGPVNVPPTAGSIEARVALQGGFNPANLPHDFPGQVTGIAYDASTGDIYAGTNGRIIKTNAAGSSWQVWGGSTSGNCGAPMVASQCAVYGGITNAAGIAYDSTTGYLYVADSTLNRIVKMKFDGSGFTSYGSTGTGVGNFSAPTGIAYDSASGYVYVADTGNNRIVRFKMDGSDTQVLGGTAAGTTTGKFSSPAGIAYDAASGYLYVGDTLNNRIVKTQFDTTGWTAYGVSGAGVGKFSLPAGIAYDSSTGYIYVQSSGNSILIKTKIDGTGWTSYGSNGQGTGQFSNIKARIAFDPASGYIYVADGSNYRVVRTAIDGSGWATVGRYAAPVPDAYQDLGAGPFAVLSDNTILTITDFLGGGNPVAGLTYGRIVRADMNANVMQYLDINFVATAGAYDPATGYMYLADKTNNRIVREKMDGSGVATYGTTGSGVGNFSNPTGITYSATTGYLYVADQGNSRLVRLSTALDGTGWSSYGTAGSGTGQFALTSTARGVIDVDPVNETLYVADTSNNRMVSTKIDGTGWAVISQVATNTALVSPVSVAVEKSGSSKVWIHETGGRTQRYDPADSSSVLTTSIANWTAGITSFVVGGGLLYGLYSFSSNYGLVSLSTSTGAVPSGLLGASLGSPVSSLMSHRIAFDRSTGNVFFYPPNGTTYPSTTNYQQVVQMRITGTLPSDATNDSSYFKIKFTYDATTGAINGYLNDVLKVSVQYPAWAPTTPLNFDMGSGGGYDQWKGGVDYVNFTTSGGDTVAPTGPTTVDIQASSDGGATYSSIWGTAPAGDPYPNWGNYGNLKFSWSGQSDNGGSGITNAYCYMSQDSLATPTASQFFACTNLGYYTTVPTLTGVRTLWVAFADAAGNISTPQAILSYRYDSGAPNPPAGVLVTPSAFTATNSFTFSWSATGPNAPTDATSYIAGFQYKTGATSGPYSDWSATQPTSVNSVTLPDAAYLSGENIFYLRSVDAAGNVSTPFLATFYFTGTAPSSPRNVTSTPSTTSQNPASSNSFAFSWSVPAISNAPIAGYRYSVNAPPTAENTQYTPSLSVPAGAYATQQGHNLFYVVAQDTAGNIDYSASGVADFYAQTASPGMPTALIGTDASIRGQSYQSTLSWVAPVGGAAVSYYEVWRSTGGGSYAKVANSPSTTYIDTGLVANTAYSYEVRALDNAGSPSAFTSAVTVTPTGRFTSPAKVLVQPVATTTASSVQLGWQMERECVAGVEIDTDAATILAGKASIKTGNLASNDKPSVTVNGLAADKNYFARGVCTDVDGNVSHTNLVGFTTSTQPGLNGVSAEAIGTSQATIVWTSNIVTSSRIEYGTTAAYGSVLDETSSGGTTRHAVILKGLSDGTAYHFRISASSPDGSAATSDDYSFVTKPLPRIVGAVAVSQGAGSNTVRVLWQTNVPTTSQASYSFNGTYSEMGSKDAVTDHVVVLSGVPDDASLIITARGTDGNGNQVEGSAAYRTPPDTKPPLVSGLLVTQSVRGTDAAATAQVTVSWTTDKPASSQVAYLVGGASGPLGQSAGSPELTREHRVVLDSLPTGSIVAYQVSSIDAHGNRAQADRASLVTSQAPTSAISVISTQLGKVLGFLGRLLPGH